MSFQSTALFILFGWLSLSLSAQAEEMAICPQVVFLDAPSEEWTEEEVKMVCGFPEAAGTAHEAWTQIPKSQALLTLRAILQSKGHHQPVIDDRGERLEVRHGPVTTVHGIHTDGAPAEFDIGRRRAERDQTLTPSTLNDLENWTLEELQTLGYPCPKIQVQASAETGDIHLQINPGEQSVFGPVTLMDLVDDPELLLAMERLRAFEPQWIYNRNLLQVTRDRILSRGIVENTHFVPSCGDPNALIQRTNPGRPRFISLGLGLNTEDYIRLILTARFSRPVGKISGLGANLFTTWQVQQVRLLTTWYPWSTAANTWLEPDLTFRRQNESPFEEWTSQIRLAYGRQRDFQSGFGIEWRAGPLFSIHQTRRGIGPDSAQEAALWAQLRIQSHEFELYRLRPRQGFLLDLSGLTNSRDLLSDFSAHTLDMNGIYLWNIGNYDPASWVLAFRGAVGTVVEDDESGGIGRLPPSRRFFLGGISDVRGFDRFSIPGDEFGRRSRATGSVEIRTSLLHEDWEALAYVDVGALGRSSFDLDEPLYWSPGFGLKWYSPIGPLRTSVANGQISGDTGGTGGPGSRWQIYLAWGELF